MTCLSSDPVTAKGNKCFVRMDRVGEKESEGEKESARDMKCDKNGNKMITNKPDNKTE